MAEKVTLTRINIFDSAKTFKDNEAQITDNELNLIKCGAVVTETWDAEDGSCWYRVWSDGSIEQGGVYLNKISKNTPTVFTLPKEFPSTNYYPIVSARNKTDISGNVALSAMVKDTRSFEIIQDGTEQKDCGCYWYARGK